MMLEMRMCAALVIWALAGSTLMRIIVAVAKRCKRVSWPAERSFEVPSRTLLPVTVPLVECVRAGTTGVPAGPSGVGSGESWWARLRVIPRIDQPVWKVLPILYRAPIHDESHNQWMKLPIPISTPIWGTKDCGAVAATSRDCHSGASRTRMRSILWCSFSLDKSFRNKYLKIVVKVVFLFFKRNIVQDSIIWSLMRHLFVLNSCKIIKKYIFTYICWRLFQQIGINIFLHLLVHFLEFYFHSSLIDATTSINELCIAEIRLFYSGLYYD